MKVRVITAVAALCVLAVVLCLFDTPVVNLAVAFLAAVAAHESSRTVGCLKYKWLTFVGVAFAALVPLTITWLGSGVVYALALVYVVLAFGVIVSKYPDIQVPSVGLLVMMTVGVTLSFNCLVLIRDAAPHKAVGIYYVAIIMASAWMCDTGAYFVGCKFGKRRLAPVVSPKKSVEGLYGGLVTAVVGNVLLSVLFVQLQHRGMIGGSLSILWNINYFYVALATPVLSLLGVLGDLSASVVKRHYGIKDFGTLFPGHGGVLDRFDSLLFIAPLVYLMMRYLPLL
ncbi:MAG: phosphatidate cytidylyltransferase [Oscillospiraceae bacterium]|nr:phosphatidate cytidylyltransferase [Oscillospiraceae bacterium]